MSIIVLKEKHAGEPKKRLRKLNINSISLLFEKQNHISPVFKIHNQ